MPNNIEPKKEITLDDLAAMCMREFTSIHERMDGMETRMATKIDLIKLEKKIDKRFDHLETIVIDNTVRIGRLEKVVYA